MGQTAKVDRVNEKLPVGKTFALGLQHVLAMYAGAITVPLLVGAAVGLDGHHLTLLIAADLFTCGIATLIQALGIGNFVGVKLPAILGCTFTALGPLISIGQSHGMQTVYGSIIVSGIFMFLIAPFFGKISKFFPTVVTGSIVTIIGTSLVPTAIQMSAGGVGSKDFGNPKNLLIAVIVMISIILFNKYLKGFMQAISVLLGLLVGTVLAGAMGMLNFTEVVNASWVSIIHPFYFGAPKFEIGPIITMSLVAMVTCVESIGVFLGIGQIVGKEVTQHDMVKGLRSEGLATVIGGIFNSFPYSTYSNNVGVLVITKVYSRFVVIASGIILMVLGLLPKFAALATIIPIPVFGGISLILFSMVAISGVRMLQDVDFTKNSNTFVAACAIGIGLGTSIVPGVFDQMPEMVKMIFGSSGIVNGTLVAVVLNLFLNHFGKKDETEEEIEFTV
jgi:xanthine permease